MPASRYENGDEFDFILVFVLIGTCTTSSTFFTVKHECVTIPEKRLKFHQAGSAPSTKSGRPWKIVLVESYSSNNLSSISKRIIPGKEGNKVVANGLWICTKV